MSLRPRRIFVLASILFTLAFVSACDINLSPAGGYPAPGSTIPIAASPAAYPAPKGTAAQAAAKAETKNVSFNTSDNVKLAGTIYTPGGNRAPAVMLLHIAYGSRNDWDAFAKKLQEAGFVVLAIDFRGHGESGGEKDWQKMPQDATAAWNYLNGQASVDTKKIVVVGASIGANVALNLGATQPNVKAVGLLSPGLDYYKIQTGDAIRTYGQRPMLMFSSSEDVYSVETQKKLEPLAGGPKQTQIFESVGHGTEMLRDSKVADVLLAWLKSVTA